MEKMKVAIITNMPAPYRIPLFEKIARIVDLTVYFTTYTEEGRDWTNKEHYNFNYKILPSYNLKISGKDILNYHFNPSIITELLKNDYDVIVSGGYASLTAKIALIICKIRKKPFILWSGSTLNEKTTMRTLFSPFIKLLVRKMDSFIVYGTKAKEYIMSMGVDPNNIFVMINVGDVDFFSEENQRLRPYKDHIKETMKIDTTHNILYVGSLNEIKGIKYLIEAFKNLKKTENDIGLILIGKGSLKKDIEKEKINGLHVFDFVQPPDLPKFYLIADLFVIPSFYDRFSIVLSEAMASGLPVMATYKNGAAIDLIRDGYNGYIIEKEDYHLFYEKIKTLLQNPELLADMGKNSKKIIINEINLDTAVEGFQEAISSVTRKYYQKGY